MEIKNTKTLAHGPVKGLIAGESGNGKTYLAATLGPKALVISAEGGLLTLHKQDVAFVDITTDDKGNVIAKDARYSRLQDVFRLLQKPEIKSKYDTIYIDSLTEVAQCLVDKLDKEFPDRKDGLVKWGEYNKAMRGVIKAFRDLPHYSVWFSCLTSVEKDENNRRYTGFNLPGKISQDLPQFFDFVFYLGITESDEGETKRYLLTKATERHTCKDRSGVLDKFERPDLGLVIKKLKGE